MNTDLPEFLRRAAETPFEAGKFDCVLMACDWVRVVRGVDPAAPWRGTYRTRIEALRIIAGAGGMADLVADGMARAGIPETDDPLPGDVGVVTMEGETVMAIRTMIGWASRGARGLIAGPAEMHRAWRL